MATKGYAICRNRVRRGSNERVVYLDGVPVRRFPSLPEAQAFVSVMQGKEKPGVSAGPLFAKYEGENR